MITLLISPPVARALAEAGYSKRAVKEYLYANASMPRRDFDWASKYTVGMDALVSSNAARDADEAKSEEMVGLLESPEIVHVIVCGDPNRNRVMVLEGNHAKPSTRTIGLPSNWDELLRRAM